MLLFPPDAGTDESVDYKAHYYANHRAFFAIFGMFTVVDIADTLLKGIPHFLALGKPYVISSVLFLIGCHHAKRTVSPVLCHFLSRPNDRDQLHPFPDFLYNPCSRSRLWLWFSVLRADIENDAKARFAAHHSLVRLGGFF